MNQNLNPLTRVSLQEVKDKFSSKKELYDFLVLDCQAFLPKVESINVYFLKQIMRGDKEVSHQLSNEA